jgi:hypothetical protein
MDELCHNIRNATPQIKQLAKRHVRNKADLMEILSHIARIERALTMYEIRIKHAKKES